MVLALSRPELLRKLVVLDIAPVAYGHTQMPSIEAMRRVDLATVASRSEAEAQMQADPILAPFLLQSLDVSPLPLKFAGGAVLVLPALVFLFAVRKYLFSLWGIANR